jgi:transcriptional regulator with PAS, ATPase and Fis domain
LNIYRLINLFARKYLLAVGGHEKESNIAALTSWASEAPAVKHTKSFAIEDAMLAQVALDTNQLCDSRLSHIVGNCADLRRVLGMVRVVAPTDTTELINGETGTGKKLISEAIHKSSNRSNGPFVKVKLCCNFRGFA